MRVVALVRWFQLDVGKQGPVHTKSADTLWCIGRAWKLPTCVVTACASQLFLFRPRFCLGAMCLVAAVGGSSFLYFSLSLLPALGLLAVACLAAAAARSTWGSCGRPNENLDRESSQCQRLFVSNMGTKWHSSENCPHLKHLKKSAVRRLLPCKNCSCKGWGSWGLSCAAKIHLIHGEAYSRQWNEQMCLVDSARCGSNKFICSKSNLAREIWIFHDWVLIFQTASHRKGLARFGSVGFTCAVPTSGSWNGMFWH